MPLTWGRGSPLHDTHFTTCFLPLQLIASILLGCGHADVAFLHQSRAVSGRRGGLGGAQPVLGIERKRSREEYSQGVRAGSNDSTFRPMTAGLLVSALTRGCVSFHFATLDKSPILAGAMLPALTTDDRDGHKRRSHVSTQISLELGGNAPFIVFNDADVALAAKGVVGSAFRNCGQTCICANRTFVQVRQHDEQQTVQ